jgi:hypothetical protein
VAEAKKDARLFADEFPGELLDPASTDWDSSAWEMAPADLRVAGIVDGEDYGWRLYQATLVREVARLVGEARPTRRIEGATS